MEQLAQQLSEEIQTLIKEFNDKIKAAGERVGLSLVTEVNIGFSDETKDEGNE